MCNIELIVYYFLTIENSNIVLFNKGIKSPANIYKFSIISKRPALKC